MWEQQKANRSRADEEIATGRNLLRSANLRAFRVANTPVAPRYVIAKALSCSPAPTNSAVANSSISIADLGHSLTHSDALPLRTWYFNSKLSQADSSTSRTQTWP